MGPSSPTGRWRARISPPALLAAMLGPPALACSPVEGAVTAKNVLLVSVDTLRPDHLSLYGYERPTSPRLDAFFAASEVHARAYAAEASTAPSVVSLLSGLYPARHGVRLLYQRLDESVRLLPDVLREAGYQTAGVVSNSVLTAEAIGLDRHFDHYDDFVSEREPNRPIYERGGEATTNAALHWLLRERDPRRPHLLWVHYIDPHGPYKAPDEKPVSFSHEGTLEIDLARVPDYQRVSDTNDGLDYVDRYDEEIAYVDREIGRLLDAYDSLELLNETLVIFTADHGETMVEHERYFMHGHHVWESVVRVPLVVRRPGGEPVLREDPVSLVDVVPTILAELGIEAPSVEVDGVPLGERPPLSPISVEADTGRVQLRARIEGNRKWFASVDRGGTFRTLGWLDLLAGEDPLHLRPGGEAGFAELESWARADPDPGGIPVEYERGERLDGPKIAPGRTRDQLEALRALGYVE